MNDDKNEDVTIIKMAWLIINKHLTRSNKRSNISDNKIDIMQVDVSKERNFTIISVIICTGYVICSTFV